MNGIFGGGGAMSVLKKGVGVSATVFVALLNPKVSKAVGLKPHRSNFDLRLERRRDGGCAWSLMELLGASALVLGCVS